MIPLEIKMVASWIDKIATRQGRVLSIFYYPSIWLKYPVEQLEPNK